MPPGPFDGMLRAPSEIIRIASLIGSDEEADDAVDVDDAASAVVDVAALVFASAAADADADVFGVVCFAI